MNYKKKNSCGIHQLLWLRLYGCSSGFILIKSVLFLSGCATLFSTKGPFERKSDHFAFISVEKFSTDWTRHLLDEKSFESEDLQKTTSPDIFFKNHKHGSGIMVNSSCSRLIEKQEYNLEKLLAALGLPLDSYKIEKKSHYLLDSSPALELLAAGKYLKKDVKINFITSCIEDCIYDLLLISSESHFPEDKKIFDQFASFFKVLRGHQRAQ